MKIKVVSRDFFAERMGSAEELELLQNYRIISLNSSSGSYAMPPFSNLKSQNLLCLTVDDILGKIRGLVLFDKKHANKILSFVKGSKLPLIIHCRAGISRSGAVGEVLNWYFNSYLQQNVDDFIAFYQEHLQIDPNPYIRKVLLETFDRHLNLKDGSCWNLLEYEIEKIGNMMEDKK